ncbi:MAG: Na/Pi cotransporter family protein [Clostridia bacterium]|nr:Na/Pi cotransporter family protein [Clostridia bacterium]
MSFFDILSLFCGLALFLFGMDAMGNALKKSAGNRLKVILGNLTSNKFKAFLLGLGVTAIIQSSSATTVMVVGFVNSGTMAFSQATGVIIGANLGTAVTAWLTALNGIGGAAADATALLSFLKPSAWMPILAVIGICMIMFGKKEKQKDLGMILMGFAVLMVGMDTMSDAVSCLSESPEFRNLMTLFSNPLVGVLVGTVLTAIVQSSSASVGILQALSSTGVISYSTAIPIILGQNIGTCITAILSSLGANKNGKRTALVHLYFNIFGVAAWISVYYALGFILRSTGTFDLFSMAESNTINMWGIAGIHTLFKLFSIIVLMPLSKHLEKLAVSSIKGSDNKGDKYTAMLDDILLDTPSIAIERSYTVANEMSHIASKSIENAMQLFTKYDSKLSDSVMEDESKVDIYEDALGSYLVKLSSKSMSESDDHDVSKLLYIIGDFERISDHAVNLVESAQEIKDKNLTFSDQAINELSVMFAAVGEIVRVTEESFINLDFKSALSVEPLEQVVDDLKEQIRLRHIARLQKVECTIEHGFVLSDILTNLERVSDHCSNIAGCLLEMSQKSSLDLHNYLSELKKDGTAYDELYKEYSSKYSLS